MMINPLLPGFLTKGHPRLKLLFDYMPALFFLLRLPSLHIPNPSRPSPCSSLHSSGKGQEMLDLGIRESRVPGGLSIWILLQVP